MVEYLQQLPNALPIIVDNDSAWPPLLEWYAKCGVPIIRLGRNGGPMAPWTLRNLSRGSEFYVVSDPDLDLTGVPPDVLLVMAAGLREYPDRIKCGLSLEINDLPPTEVGRAAAEWERQFWRTRLDDFWWNAPVDTTFAMYRANFHDTRQRLSPAMRSDRPYTAKHLPWYMTDSLTAETRHYLQRCGKNWSFWAKRILKATGNP
jgi:hypothetical protein